MKAQIFTFFIILNLSHQGCENERSEFKSYYNLKSEASNANYEEIPLIRFEDIETKEGNGKRENYFRSLTLKRRKITFVKETELEFSFEEEKVHSDNEQEEIDIANKYFQNEDEILHYLGQTNKVETNKSFVQKEIPLPIPEYFGCYSYKENRKSIPEFYIIQEKMQCSLGSLMANSFSKLDNFEKLDYSINFLRNLQQIHQKGVLHCQLQPENLMIDLNGKLKITGFGKSRKVIDANCDGDFTEYSAFEILFKEPLQIKNKEYFKSDVFASAVTVLKIMSGGLEFTKSYLQYQEFLSTNLNDVNFNRDSDIPTNIFKSLKLDLQKFMPSLKDLEPLKDNLKHLFFRFISSTFYHALSLNYQTRYSLDQFVFGLEEIKKSFQLIEYYNGMFDILNRNIDEVDNQRNSMEKDLFNFSKKINWNLFEDCRAIKFENSDNQIEDFELFVSGFIFENLKTLLHDKGLENSNRLKNLIEYLNQISKENIQNLDKKMHLI